MKRKFQNTEVEIVEGDITLLDRDAIVNAANDRLQLGAGVAGAIRERGGPSIQEECDRIGSTFVGGAVITGGGDLKARHVIHAVGPRMGEGDEDSKLKNAILNGLKVADENSLKSIAFPAISTGIFGFPLERAADIMVSAVIEHIEAGTGLGVITFCLYGKEAYGIFDSILRGWGKFD